MSDFSETCNFGTDFRIVLTCQISRKYKLHENPLGGTRVVPCGRTDKHGEVNCRFPKFCERIRKLKGTLYPDIDLRKSHPPLFDCLFCDVLSVSYCMYSVEWPTANKLWIQKDEYESRHSLSVYYSGVFREKQSKITKSIMIAGVLGKNWARYFPIASLQQCHHTYLRDDKGSIHYMHSACRGIGCFYVRCLYEYLNDCTTCC